MRYDLEKGTKIGEHALRKEIDPSGPGFLAGGMRTFQFLPDDRGWLVSGHQIVERETGTPVWSIDPRPTPIAMTHNPRFLDAPPPPPTRHYPRPAVSWTPPTSRTLRAERNYTS